MRRFAIAVAAGAAIAVVAVVLPVVLGWTLGITP